MIETLPPTEEPMETESPTPQTESPVVNGENKENQDAPPPANEPTETEDTNMSEEKKTTDTEKVLQFLYKIYFFN